MQWTASQLIAVLIGRLGGGPQVVTLDEMRRFKATLPCVFTGDGDTITVEVRDDERLPMAMK